MKLSVPSRWEAALLVCGKCEKKLSGGFGHKGKEKLSKLLQKRGGGKGRKAGRGVVQSKCLSLCPKGAVTVIDGAHPGQWHIVPAGTPVEEVEVRLGLGFGTVGEVVE